MRFVVSLQKQPIFRNRLQKQKPSANWKDNVKLYAGGESVRATLKNPIEMSENKILHPSVEWDETAGAQRILRLRRQVVFKKNRIIIHILLSVLRALRRLVPAKSTESWWIRWSNPPRNWAGYTKSRPVRISHVKHMAVFLLCCMENRSQRLAYSVGHRLTEKSRQ